MTKALVLGMGGVGTIAAYTLQSFNEDVEVTAVIRSDYDVVTTKGYTIAPIVVYTKAEDNEEVNFKPKNVVKSLDDAAKHGPFDYIVVATKVIPQKSNNIWDQVYDLRESLVKENTGIVLLQNGIAIEKHWRKLGAVQLISGVSYISSINTAGKITMYSGDRVNFGLFDSKDDPTGVLTKWIKLYSNPKFNEVHVDENVQFTRMKKLIYNASYNTVCCLTDSDVGILYSAEGVVDDVIRTVMEEILLIANQDLKTRNSDKLLSEGDIDFMIKDTAEFDAPVNYAPSMLVDFRNKRPIELESILGNLIQIYKDHNPGVDVKKNIPYLNFLYQNLKVVLYKLTHN